MTNLVIGLLVSMVFSAFFSGMEIAFVSSNRLRVEMDRDKHGLAQRGEVVGTADLSGRFPRPVQSRKHVSGCAAKAIR